MGADYPIYFRVYQKHGDEITYSQIFDVALDREGNLEMEWLYVLISKILYDIGMPFYILTLVIAIIAILIKYNGYSKNTIYSGFAMLLYMYPSLFTSDGGQMRQGAAMAMLFICFEYIKQRRLLMFMFVIYLALGFHHSVILFIAMYWLVLVPLNSTRIMLLVLASMVLSPLKLYEYIKILDVFSSTGAYTGFQNYGSDEIDVSTGFIKLTDLICILYTYFLVTYDKEACEKIPYYEYMRNIVVAGICLYFIFRWNMIFSSRLVMNFLIFAPMALVNIVAAVSSVRVKKSLHLVLVGFAIFSYFVYVQMQATKVGYSYDLYRNFLWIGF